MNELTSKEKILKKVRNALKVSSEAPYPITDNAENIYAFDEEIAEVSFAKSFKNLGGNFIYCTDEKEFCKNLNHLKSIYSLNSIFCKEKNIIEILNKNNILYTSAAEKSLKDYDCSLTNCEFLISRTGSIIISASDKTSRRTFFTSPFHFVVAYSSQVTKDLDDALNKVKFKYKKLPSFISIISGPSRTADIEKTLVVGAHGPKEIFLFFIDDLI